MSISVERSRLLAQVMLKFFNVKYSLDYGERIPSGEPLIVISNHRSFLDAALLLEAIPGSLRIACHHFMGKTPGLKQFVSWLGCFPLAANNQGQQYLFRTAQNLLTDRQWLGVFPEGALPMVEPPNCDQVGKFQRGFAHLVYRLKIDNLTVLPVAIASLEETKYQSFPISWLSKLDPYEPIFKRKGLHPVIIYDRVKLVVGHPHRLSYEQKQAYKGKQARQMVSDLTNSCQQQIAELLKEGCSKGGFIN